MLKKNFTIFPFANPSRLKKKELQILHIWYLFINIQMVVRKNVVNVPKKRGRKPKLDLMDDDALVKGDVDLIILFIQIRTFKKNFIVPMHTKILLQIVHDILNLLM